MGRNGNWDGSISVIMIVTIVGKSGSVLLLATFVGLHYTKARFILKVRKINYVIFHYYGVMRENI